MKTKDFKIGGEFKPSSKLKDLYYLQFIVILLIMILPWYLPVVLFSGPAAAILISVGILVLMIPVTILFVVWVPKYYETVVYKLTDNEITWRRGVWFRNTGVVPYNRITNVDVSQGPISRIFGIASLKLQTAGYSAQPNAEMKLIGIKDFEGLRNLLINLVKGKKPVATETFEEKDVNEMMLDELIKIRKFLGKGKTR
jgi:hypothetical protein